MQTELIFSPEASHVNLTHLQESEKEKKMNAICGLKCLEQLEKFNHVGLWAKTFSGLLIGQTGWFSTKCKLTWKLKGTKFSRMYFQLVPQTHRTGEIGFGLLPTPTVSETIECTEAREVIMRGNSPRIKSNQGTDGQAKLNDMARVGLLPTPIAMDSNGATANMKSIQVKDGSMHSVTLSRALTMGMLPTPTADDNPAKNTGKRNQNGLQKIAYQTTGKTSQLNPRFVMEMMGFPPNWTELPFLNGEMKVSKPEEMQ